MRKLSSVVSQYDVSKLGVMENNKVVSQYNRYQTYKITSALQVTNEFKRKVVVLPKGSVITGFSDDEGNLSYIDNTSLSLKNQKRIHKLGNWHYSYLINKNNSGASNPYSRKTAFSYKSLSSLPALFVRTAKAKKNGVDSQTPFISVTADSNLVYHKSGQTFSATRYAKIKKYKRTHSKLTYYLSRRVSGVSTKKVKVGKSCLYRVSFKLSHVFQDEDNSDLGAYNLTVNNGKQAFLIPVDGNTPMDSYLDMITGAGDVTSHDKEISYAYIQGLY